MVFDWRVRLGLIVGGAVVVAVAIAGAAWGGLDSALVGDLLKMVGSFVAGLGIAGGKGRAAAVLLLVALPWLPACGGSQETDVARCTATVLRCAGEIMEDCVCSEDDDSCSLPVSR
jgi:hypothetical protein